MANRIKMREQDKKINTYQKIFDSTQIIQIKINWTH